MSIYVTDKDGKKVKVAGAGFGAPGADGKSAYQAAVESGYSGTETAFNGALAGVPGHMADQNNPHGVEAEQIGAVPTTRTVNGKPLSGDITLTAADVGALPLEGGIATGELKYNGDVDSMPQEWSPRTLVTKRFVEDLFGAAAPAAHNHSASSINSGTLPVARGGTGVTAVGGTDYTTTRFRGSQLRNADTNPTTNGTINWTYK